MNNNMLTGELPDCWWNLQNLQVMELSHNDFSGEIPAVKTSYNCSSCRQQLHRINMVWKGWEIVFEKTIQLMTGAIPPSMSSLSTLSILDLSNNHLSGKIPSDDLEEHAIAKAEILCESLETRALQWRGARAMLPLDGSPPPNPYIKPYLKNGV
ncbi:hypothetical protein ABZP36_010692 [Zizania latifolia]